MVELAVSEIEDIGDSPSGSLYQRGAETERLCALRDQHSATPDLPGLECGIDFNRLLQRELSGFRVDPSIARHRNHLHQFDSRTPIRNAHNTAVGRAAVVEVVVTPTQADNSPHAVAPEQFGAEVKSRLHAYTVKHQTGAARAGDVPYLLGGRVNVARVDHVVCAERLRLLQLRRIDIGRDDAHTRTS
jgi:hypothetical protein